MCVRKDWGEEHTAAFLTLKAAFKSYPVLRLPDFGRQFYLVTDSCDHAIGGAVRQMYEHEGCKTLMPVAYHSRKMSKHEVNYPGTVCVSKSAWQCMIVLKEGCPIHTWAYC